jgi:RimJ/RimL family protein N-acetyltransferase
VTAVPELRNDGIILNAHNDSEVAAHLAGEDEETARRFGWWPAYSTEETVRAAYANWARNWQDDGPVRAFAARDPGSGALVGNCELRIGPDGTGEVSYWTHAGKRGRGYASSALALLVGYAASIGVTRLEAHVAPDNHASRHVAEAADFTQADTITDGDGTEFIRYTRDASGDGAAPSLSRPGARFRDCSRPVSPDLSPNPPCASQRNGLSTVPAVRLVQLPRGWGSGCRDIGTG